MRKQATPYKIAEIAYNPAWPDMPWYVIRTGTIPEQGGLGFGIETVSFESIEDATTYLVEFIKKDLDTFKEKIKEKEFTIKG